MSTRSPLPVASTNPLLAAEKTPPMSSDTSTAVQPERPVPRVTGTARILERIGADMAAAGLATLLISPVICIIDRSIMENTSGRSKSVLDSVGNSLKTVFTRPHQFFFARPFGLIFMTYFGTYITANSIDTVSSIRRKTDIRTATAGGEKFVATSAANMGLSLVKDRNFARMFGTGSPRPVPLPVFFLFSLRDAMTIGFSFNIPPRLAPYVPQDLAMRPESIAQFIAPAGCQFLSTPLHLFGLDLYNRGNDANWKERLHMIKTKYLPSAFARVCRIVPAFGMGGVANSRLRRAMMGKIEERV